MRGAHVGACALVLGSGIACGGNTDATPGAQADASPGEQADAAPEVGSNRCQALGGGVERVAAGLRNVTAIDANSSSLTLAVANYPKLPLEYRIVSISKATCAERVLVSSADAFSGISATDQRVVWTAYDQTLFAEAPLWNATPLDLPGLLGVRSPVYAQLVRNGADDDLTLTQLGIDAMPSWFGIASLNPDRVEVLADLTGLEHPVMDVAPLGDSFLVAGGAIALERGPKGSISIAGRTGAPRLLFETDQFLPVQLVVRQGFAYFLGGGAIRILDPGTGAAGVLVAEGAEALAPDPMGMYWAGAGRVQVTPWSGGPSRELSAAGRTTFLAVDPEHVYWLQIADDQGVHGESYDLLRVAK
jgi:hypothetical protein